MHGDAGVVVLSGTCLEAMAIGQYPASDRVGGFPPVFALFNTRTFVGSVLRTRFWGYGSRAVLACPWANALGGSGALFLHSVLPRGYLCRRECLQSCEAHPCCRGSFFLFTGDWTFKWSDMVGASAWHTYELLC